MLELFLRIYLFIIFMGTRKSRKCHPLFENELNERFLSNQLSFVWRYPGVMFEPEKRPNYNSWFVLIFIFWAKRKETLSQFQIEATFNVFTTVGTISKCCFQWIWWLLCAVLMCHRQDQHLRWQQLKWYPLNVYAERVGMLG